MRNVQKWSRTQGTLYVQFIGDTALCKVDTYTFITVQYLNGEMGPLMSFNTCCLAIVVALFSFNNCTTSNQS